MKNIIYAPNIHQGGGKALLLPILEELKGAKNIVFVLDARMSLPVGGLSGEIYRVKPTLFSRLWFEWRLCYLIKPDTLLLCMGNLPPLWTHSGQVTVFVQNRYLIDDVSLAEFSLPIRMRIKLERWWIRSRAAGVERFVVQTPTMQRLLQQTLGRSADILPFAALPETRNTEGSATNKTYDFLYVASGEPHKNHRCLIRAWIEMAGRGEFPSLCLTLDSGRFPKLCAWIDAIRRQHGLKIEITGNLSHQGIQHLYRTSRALIYPSFFESFGLPLLEATAAGLPVAAADVDYVHDVINPTAVFDSDSPESIANTVMNLSETPAKVVVELLDAKGFLMRVFRN